MPSIDDNSAQVDVLIIGAGPAGLMMAEWLAKYGIHARIVDKRNTKVFNGQADGLSPRSLKILDSIGFGQRLWSECHRLQEIASWNRDKKGVIRRSDRIPDTIPGISRFRRSVLHPGRVERFFLDLLQHESQIHVQRGVIPAEIKIHEDSVEDNDAYPMEVKLRHLSEAEATSEQSSTSANGTQVQDGLFQSNIAKANSADFLESSKFDSKANY